MTELAKNITQIGTPDQDIEQIAQQKPWERMKNEPANWYMRFQVYLNLGPGRSLRKALASEPSGKKATKGDTISVPGSWQRASKLWNWAERAHAYDLTQQENNAQAMREMASGSYYASKTARIMELSNLAEMLKRNIKADMEYKNFLATIARLQSVFKDIEALMVGMGETFEGIADAAAYKQYIKNMVDLIRKSAESQDNPKKALQDFVNQLRA